MRAPSREVFTKIVYDVITRSEARKNVSNGRRAYWKRINPSNYIPGNSRSQGTIVIVNPLDRDRGTMFVPSRGKAYYDDLK